MEGLRLPREARQGELLCALRLDRENLRLQVRIGSRLSPERGEPPLWEGDWPLEELYPAEEPAWGDKALNPLAYSLRRGRRGREEGTENARRFLQEIAEQRDPLRGFAALRLWNAYLTAREARDQEAAGEQFRRQGEEILQPFLGGRAAGQSLTLRYLPGREEWAEGALPGPLLRYCELRLEDWGCVPRRCKVCGRRFLASGPRMVLCGPACRRTQAARNKRAFDQRARENIYDRLYQNACQSWRNRIHRGKKGAEPPEGLETAFARFREEAMARKREVKEGTLSVEDFARWIAEQEGRLKAAVESP